MVACKFGEHLSSVPCADGCYRKGVLDTS